MSQTGSTVLSATNPCDSLSGTKRDRQISEYDMVAYSKEETSLSVQRNVMRRLFASFALKESDGKLNSSEVTALCEYLGDPVHHASNGEESPIDPLLTSLAALFPRGADGKETTIDFPAFWEWWLTHHSDNDHGVQAFKLVAADFSVPFHEQQLITKEVGEKFTPAYRVQYFFKNLETQEEKQVSPWHDIPLYIKDIVRTVAANEQANRYNFICEIPKWTRAKFEIATNEQYNPIKQDMKNGVPRFYHHGDMMWNYGAFPQTWESTEICFVDDIRGDNDPLDVIEIGMTQARTGSATAVKVLGVLGMIDDGQMDWKVIAISWEDPIAKFVNDIDDVPKFLPGCLEALREWLRVYKICQGGVENKFAFNGEFKNKAYAMKVIDESHLMWANLRKVKKTSHF